MLREPTYVADDDMLPIDALKFIVSHDDLIRRFTDLTGIEGGELRAQVQDPVFLVGILDFVLAHEPDVLDLADQLGIPPREIGLARNRLAKRAGVPLEDFPS